MLERMWSKENTPPLMVGMQTCTTSLEISMLVSQKIRNQPTSRPDNTIIGIAQLYYKDICSTMFTAALFVITKACKQQQHQQTTSTVAPQLM